MKKRIALLYGGAPGEHDVSVMGYEYVSKLLINTEYDVIPIYVTKDGIWSIRTDKGLLDVYPIAKDGGELYTGDTFIKIDAAIPLLHGKGGEDGSVQGALECAGIPYVGADARTSALCIDKAYSKAIADSIGIPTLKGVSPRKYASTDAALKLVKDNIGFPAFIKPRRLGSSVGAYQVRDEDEFREKYPTASALGGGLVMIEELLGNKRELECAFFELNGKRTVTPPGEILIDGFYGYDEKYGGKTRTAARADIDSRTAGLITDYAQALADAMLLRHLGRVDFFLSDDKIFFNEINTFPGFTGESLYPKMLARYGIAPKDAILAFVEDALSC